MKIELVGDDALTASLGAFADDLGDESSLLGDVAAIVRRDARALAPKRTGRLAASITTRRVIRGYVVRTSVPYAQYVHYGSVHNPVPRPFMDMAARRVDPQAGRAAERRVSAAQSRAGL